MNHQRPASLPAPAACPICLGSGWVCENHPDKPWEHPQGCSCGAGKPCVCNPIPLHPFQKVILGSTPALN